MERGTSTNLQQIEGKLLAAFERHAADGRAMTIESLAATAGVAGRPKELALALKHLIERGLLQRAGEDPIPGSAIAFRLVRPALPERLCKAEDQPAQWHAFESSRDDRFTRRGKTSAAIPIQRPGRISDRRAHARHVWTEAQTAMFPGGSISWCEGWTTIGIS